MASAFFTYRLKPGVTRGAYERWILDFDYPHVQRIADTTGVIVSQRIYRAEGTVFGGGPLPYDYIEVIEYTNLEDYLDMLQNNPDAHAISEQMPNFVEVLSNAHGTFIEPGVQAP